jgi:hypothetical protein
MTSILEIFTTINMNTLYFLILMPSNLNTPYFIRYNIIKFIKRFEDIYKEYIIINLKGKLLKYCNNSCHEIIKALLEFKDKAKT